MSVLLAVPFFYPGKYAERNPPWIGKIETVYRLMANVKPRTE